MTEISNKTKVAIFGTAPNTHEQGMRLFGDPCFDFWGLNQLYIVLPQIVPHATAWFNIHKDDRLLEKDHRHFEFLAGLKCPVFMRKKHPKIPTSQPLPKDEILSTFKREYVTSQISWMLAYAIMSGYQEIHIYGVDMATHDEYIGQRPNLEYWIGMCDAPKSNIELYIPPNSDLCKSLTLYGYDFNAPFVDKCALDKKNHSRKINECKEKLTKLLEQRNRMWGALNIPITTDQEKASAQKFINESFKTERKLEQELMQYVGMCSALTYLARVWAQRSISDEDESIEDIASSNIN